MSEKKSRFAIINDYDSIVGFYPSKEAAIKAFNYDIASGEIEVEEEEDEFRYHLYELGKDLMSEYEYVPPGDGKFVKKTTKK